MKSQRKQGGLPVPIVPPSFVDTLAPWISQAERKILDCCPRFLRRIEDAFKVAVDEAIVETPASNRSQVLLGINPLERGASRLFGYLNPPSQVQRPDRWVALDQYSVKSPCVVPSVVSIMTWHACQTDRFEGTPECLQDAVVDLLDPSGCAEFTEEFLCCYQHVHQDLYRHDWLEHSEEQKAAIGNEIVVGCALKGWEVAGARLASLLRGRADFESCARSMEGDPWYMVESRLLAEQVVKILLVVKRSARIFNKETMTAVIAVLYEAYLVARSIAFSLVAQHVVHTGEVPKGHGWGVATLVGTEGSSVRRVCIERSSSVLLQVSQMLGFPSSLCDAVVEDLGQYLSLPACCAALWEVKVHEEFLSRHYSLPVGDDWSRIPYESSEVAAAYLQRKLAEGRALDTLESDGRLEKRCSSSRKVRITTPLVGNPILRGYYYGMIVTQKNMAYEKFQTILASFKAGILRSRRERREFHDRVRRNRLRFNQSMGAPEEDLLFDVPFDGRRRRFLDEDRRLRSVLPWKASRDAQDLYLIDLIGLSRGVEMKLRAHGVRFTTWG